LASQVDAESRQRVSWEERWGREDRGGKRKVGVLEEERKEETRKEDPPSDGREERGGNPDAERVVVNACCGRWRRGGRGEVERDAQTRFEIHVTFFHESQEQSISWML
jgi:hypothetical protein